MERRRFIRTGALVVLLACAAVAIPAQTIHQQLIDAAYENDTQRAVELLRQGASVYKMDDRYGRWARAITFAAENGNAELVSILLAHGANDYSGIRQAIRNGHIGIVWMFLAAGADVSDPSSLLRSGPYILDAVETNQLEIVKLLVDHGSPVQFEGHWKGEAVTLRTVAERTGNAELVEYLESEGMR